MFFLYGITKNKSFFQIYYKKNLKITGNITTHHTIKKILDKKLKYKVKKKTMKNNYVSNIFLCKCNN